MEKRIIERMSILLRLFQVAIIICYYNGVASAGVSSASSTIRPRMIRGAAARVIKREDLVKVEERLLWRNETPLDDDFYDENHNENENHNSNSSSNNNQKYDNKDIRPGLVATAMKYSEEKASKIDPDDVVDAELDVDTDINVNLDADQQHADPDEDEDEDENDVPDAVDFAPLAGIIDIDDEEETEQQQQQYYYETNVPTEVNTNEMIITAPSEEEGGVQAEVEVEVEEMEEDFVDDDGDDDVILTLNITDSNILDDNNETAISSPPVRSDPSEEEIFEEAMAEGPRHDNKSDCLWRVLTGTSCTSIVDGDITNGHQHDYLISDGKCRYNDFLGYYRAGCRRPSGGSGISSPGKAKVLLTEVFCTDPTCSTGCLDHSVIRPNVVYTSHFCYLSAYYYSGNSGDSDSDSGIVIVIDGGVDADANAAVVVDSQNAKNEFSFEFIGGCLESENCNVI